MIVESPSKAKTISKYLNHEYEVRASVGHIRDLPKSNKKAIDIDGGFIPHYEISPGKNKIVAELKELSLKASVVLLATDPDREGEAIAWHIEEACGIKNAKESFLRNHRGGHKRSYSPSARNRPKFAQSPRSPQGA